jgi:hypothetical protein
VVGYFPVSVEAAALQRAAMVAQQEIQDKVKLAKLVPVEVGVGEHKVELAVEMAHRQIPVEQEEKPFN